MQKLALMLSALAVTCSWGWELRDSVPDVISEHCYSDLLLVRRLGQERYIFYVAGPYGSQAIYAYDPAGNNWSEPLVTWPPGEYVTPMAFASSENTGVCFYVLYSSYFPGPSRYESHFAKYVFEQPTGCKGELVSLPAPPFSVSLWAQLVYRPNLNYAPVNPIPGWLYTLVPQWYYSDLWRYSVPAPENIAVDGIHPPDGSTIADNTPLFVWVPTPGATLYRLEVSTCSDFTSLELSVESEGAEYQCSEELENGSHYWRTAHRDAEGAWSEWSAVHTFDLQYGWLRLESCPRAASELCLVSREVAGQPPWAPAESLYTLDYDDDRLFCFHAGSNTWEELTRIPVVPYRRRDLVTDPGEQPRYGFHALAGDPYSSEENRLWSYHLARDRWYADVVELPGPRSWGTQLAVDPHDPGPAGPLIYLALGGDTRGFYRQVLPGSDSGGGRLGGEQSGAAPVGVLKQARVVPSPGGVEVRFNLSTPSKIRVVVHDAAGREVKNLYTGPQRAGEQYVAWDWTDETGRCATAGAYFLLVDCESTRFCLKVVRY